MHRPSFRTVLALLALLAAFGCNRAAPPSEAQATGPISLLDRWADVHLEHPTPPPQQPPRGEFRFDDTATLEFQWSVLEGVEDLRVEEGRLLGRTTSETPILLLEAASPLGTEDELWAAKITLQASAGTRVGVHPIRTPGPPRSQVIARAEEWPLASALIAGEDAQTYTVELDRVFTLELPLATSGISQVLVRPSNVKGAEFAMESVQFLFRKEHLASIQSGPGWHGLGEVFRESLVSRSPETLRFEVNLPSKPWLELNLGTVEQTPPVFEVTAGPVGEEPAVIERFEVQAPETWRPVRLDLPDEPGAAWEIRLSAVAEQPGTLAFWGTPVVRSAVTADDRPQAVVVFLADTLRKDHLDAWGHDRPTAPTLARLAAEGVRFDDTLAQATWTKVSVSSILTSLYPSTTGVANLNDRVAAAETTLAEAFRGAGYATFATSSVPFSGQLTNLHQGVEVLYEFGASKQPPGEYQSKTAEAWVDEYLSWLEVHRDVPTFALIHAMDPHSPFKPQAPYDTMWAEEEDAQRFADQSKRLEPHIESPLMRRFMAPSREEIVAAGVDEESFVRHQKNWYDGSIRGMDAQLERVLNRLTELDLGDRTLLAFISDHGEAFLEHGVHWHGTSVYGELTNVPLVFWGQGVPSGRVVEETVQNLDIMPTLLDLAKIPVPERAQGRSLTTLMNGEEKRALPAFSEHHAEPRDPNEFTRFAMVDGGYKLIWNLEPPAGVADYELYDHEADPLNLEDLAADHPEVVQSMATELERWRSWAEEMKLDQAAAEAEMSAEELERLRSLGYVD